MISRVFYGPTDQMGQPTVRGQPTGARRAASSSRAWCVVRVVRGA